MMTDEAKPQLDHRRAREILADEAGRAGFEGWAEMLRDERQAATASPVSIRAMVRFAEEEAVRGGE